MPKEHKKEDVKIIIQYKNKNENENENKNYVDNFQDMIQKLFNLYIIKAMQNIKKDK